MSTGTIGSSAFAFRLLEEALAVSTGIARGAFPLDINKRELRNIKKLDRNQWNLYKKNEIQKYSNQLLVLRYTIYPIFKYGIRYK